MTVRTGARRERMRAATIDEIKQTALGLMREHGSTDIRFTDIARLMGMTPPALYRYFADRDELLTALIVDGYDDLGHTVAQARDVLPGSDLAGRWVAGAQAYRQWARREPERFALLFGLPVPGYAAPEAGATTEAAQRAMSQLSQLFLDAQQRGQLAEPLLRDAAPILGACALGKAPDADHVLPADTFQALLHSWAALHGFTCLEAYGHLDWMPPEARDALFLSQVKLTARASGLPVPD